MLTSETETNTDKLRMELIRVQIEQLRVDVTSLRNTVSDNEKRLRAVEEAATQFRLLLYMTAGGGAVGLINLFITLAHIK